MLVYFKNKIPTNTILVLAGRRIHTEPCSIFLCPSFNKINQSFEFCNFSCKSNGVKKLLNRSNLTSRHGNSNFELICFASFKFVANIFCFYFCFVLHWKWGNALLRKNLFDRLTNYLSFK